MNNIKLVKDGNCYYLTQSLYGMNLYQRTKAIKQFINNETKILEDCIEHEIRAILNRNGLIVEDTSESALNDLFSALNEKGKDIDIVDIYKDRQIYGCVLLGKSPNDMTVWLEDDDLLQCGCKVKEKEL